MVRRKGGRNIFGSRGVIGRCRGMVLGCRGVVFWGSGVVSLSLIGDISHKALVAIGVVADMLDASIRKVDRVGSLHIARSVAALISAEHSLGVVVCHGVAVGVGEHLVRIVGWLSMVGSFHRGVVGRGSMVCWCWGVVSGCSWSCVGVSIVGGCRGCVSRCRGGVCGCRGGIGRCWGMVCRGRSWCRGVIGRCRGVVRRGMVRYGSYSCNQAKEDLKMERFQNHRFSLVTTMTNLHVSCDGSSSTEDA